MSSEDVRPIRFESTAARLRAALDAPADLNGRADPGARPDPSSPADPDRRTDLHPPTDPGGTAGRAADVPPEAAADLLAYLRGKAGAGRLERAAAGPAQAAVLAAAVEEALR